MYKVNEIFYTLQGEGAHSGIPAVFIRFSGCNLRCPWCDTDFTDFSEMTAEQIVAEAIDLYDIPNERRKMVVLTGGEPSLQVDKPLINALHAAGFYICIETNGTRPLPEGIDYHDKVLIYRPATGDTVLTHVTRIENAGDFASWKATRALNDIDLKLFEVRMRADKPLRSPHAGESAIWVKSK